MSVEDRLLSLLVQARQQGGDAALADAPGLIARLSSQAPDLHGEIRALVSALATGAPARIAAAANQTVERQAIAAEIAGRERLSIGVVDPALEVLMLSGIEMPRGMPTPAPAPGGWAGDSVLVGGGAQPAPAWQPQPAPQPSPGQPQPYAPAGPWSGEPPVDKPVWEQTWFYVVIALLIVGGAFYYMKPAPQQQVAQQDGPVQPQVGPDGQPIQPQQGPNGPQPQVGPDGQPIQPQQGQPPQPDRGGPPQPGGGPNGPQNGGGQGELQIGGPALSTDQASVPRIPIRRAANGALGLGFSLAAQGGTVNGLVVLPPNGWDAGEGTIIGQRGNATSLGSGKFVRTQVNGAPMRVMTPTWKQDGLGVGTMCVAIAGQQGQQDVNPAGALMCLMDSTCARPVGCGMTQ